VIGKGGTRNPEEITKREERKKNLEDGGLRPPPPRAKSSFLTTGNPFPVIFFPKVTRGSKKLKKNC